jgi:hypothetical protein
LVTLMTGFPIKSWVDWISLSCRSSSAWFILFLHPLQKAQPSPEIGEGMLILFYIFYHDL